MANHRFWRGLTATSTLVSISGAASASGFAVPEGSITGLGASNALVADYTEAGALPYNPATAVFQKGHSLGGGLMLVNPNISVTTTTGTHDSQGEDIILIPLLQGSYRVSENMALTLTTTAPFGLESVWDATAPVFPLLAGAGHPTDSQVELADINPAIAFRVNDNLALSLGVDYYFVKTVEFDADVIASEGDGDAWGWSASALYVQDNWSLGLSFHSATDAGIEGSSTVPGVGSSPATAELPIPWRAQAGIRFLAAPDWAVEFDISRTGWSSFDTLVINNGFGGVSSINNWEDANAYRLAVTYQMNSKTRLRAGYTFDETPQPREFFSARIPDNDRHLFSVGLSHKIGKDMELDAGYMFVSFEDYTHNQPLGAPPADPNGSFLYNGDYSASVHLFGLGLTKRFN